MKVKQKLYLVGYDPDCGATVIAPYKGPTEPDALDVTLSLLTRETRCLLDVRVGPPNLLRGQKWKRHSHLSRTSRPRRG